MSKCSFGAFRSPQTLRHCTSKMKVKKFLSFTITANMVFLGLSGRPGPFGIEHFTEIDLRGAESLYKLGKERYGAYIHRQRTAGKRIVY